MNDSIKPLLHLSEADDRSEVVSEMRSFAHMRSLKRELLAELHQHWEQGQPIAPESLKQRWPESPRADSDFASLLLEDYCQRRRHGEDVSVDDYAERFPEHTDSLARLLRQQEVLRSMGGPSENSGATLKLPDVGDELFGFRLHYELGRGGFARVFLGEQSNLASRPVVLKVSAIRGDEPQTLAQLQHTHIVPIYSVHEDARAGLRAVCMPYFGGASLSRVLQHLWQNVSTPSQGAEFIRALEAVQSPIPARNLQVLEPMRAEPAADAPTLLPLDPQRVAAEYAIAPAPAVALPLPRNSTLDPRTILDHLSYVQVVVWTIARLAEALQHAHDRGVLHRDIKPSNILIAADGQPLLLDFNLACDQNRDQAQVTLGGTVAYMAPEHLQALAGHDPALARHVDHRSDIYSLGMVLFEMLAGRSPFDHSASYSPLPALIEAMAVERSRIMPSVRQDHPEVPWSLESILRKCLAPDPAQRYQHARDLAEDLGCFLENRPLRHAPELSRIEQLHKWARRHPRLTSSGSVAGAAAVLLVAVALLLIGVYQHLHITQHRLEIAEAQDRSQAFEAGTLDGLRLVNTTDELNTSTLQGVEIIQKTLGLYGILDRVDWQDDAAWQYLDEETQKRLAEDARELLLLLAWARAQQTPKEDAPQRALELLERAAAIRGLQPSAALLLHRANYLERAGDREAARAARRTAQQVPLVSARDHYLLAWSHARQRCYAEASAELNQTLELAPRHYWALCLRGLCHQHRQEHPLAVADFSECLGLGPEAWVYLNRGVSLYHCDQKEGAILDYTAAVKSDPRLLQAYWNRGVTLLELTRFAEALADFDQALNLGRKDALLHVQRGVALEGLGKAAEADAAFQQAFACLDQASEAAGDDIRCRYAIAVTARLPQLARQTLKEVLNRQPDQYCALYGQGVLCAQENRPLEGLEFFQKAIDANPVFLEARRFRAILLAREGRFKEASQEINSCLSHDPKGGMTLYAAACVAALASKIDRSATAMALQFLQSAFVRGYGQDKASEDADLDALRHQPAFQRLLHDIAKKQKTIARHP